jgi:hypothetical protein
LPYNWNENGNETATVQSSQALPVLVVPATIGSVPPVIEYWPLPQGVGVDEGVGVGVGDAVADGVGVGDGAVWQYTSVVSVGVVGA